VCATSKKTSEVVCLTSYRSPRGGGHRVDSVKIWEACRATSAATTFFDPIKIGEWGEEFVDGALGANNPVYAVWSQAQDFWGAERPRCLVSIGTGIPSLNEFRDDVLHINHTLIALATETEQTAERFHRDKSTLSDEGCYYRFNVVRGLEDIGLEESKKRGEIASATDRYINSQDVFRQMQGCASRLLERSS
jgi:predicted acylesterase/phospholipase RssA